MELYGYAFSREDDLQHHGIKGQKWGVRRFQNEDGTWTAAGRERYGDGNSKSVAGTARRALAKVYDTNAKYYEKHGNTALASANKALKEAQLAKADAADQKKAEKVAASNQKKEAKAAAAEQKKAEKAKAIEDKIANAKSSAEMTKAMQAKAKADIRSKQNVLSRTINDITGYNNALAERVVQDVKSSMILKDVQSQRATMTRGQKFVDFLSSGSDTQARAAYQKEGYKNLKSEYEKYRDSGGIKRSQKRLNSERRMEANRQAHERQRQQAQAERQYEREKKQREEDMRRVAAQMNYMTGLYERAQNRNA